MKILCVGRGTKYSPNLAGSDAAILEAVAQTLQTQGHEVSTISEESMDEVDLVPFDCVLTMARDIARLALLKRNTDETTQKKFINSIDGILTCTNKAAVATQMLEAGVPQPEFLVGEHHNLLYCSAEHKEGIVAPLWLKNCEGSATIAEDTMFCCTKEELDKALARLESRGIGLWMAQEHQPGDLVKFYGVEGTPFFHWRYASQGHSKFGLEAINGKEQGYPFDAKRIKFYADLLARQLRVPIYGGDVIIDSEGNFWFIDFNDFPSFSTCRDEAAKAIAQRITQA